MQGLNTGSFFDKHQSAMGGSRQALSLMRPDKKTITKSPNTDDDKKTAGGALAAAGGGAAGGAMAGGAVGQPWWGAAIGGAVGFASYLMS